MSDFTAPFYDPRAAAEEMNKADEAARVERLRRENAPRRERIATAVLAGICANASESISMHPGNAPHDIKIAVSYADALILALDAKPEGT